MLIIFRHSKHLFPAAFRALAIAEYPVIPARKTQDGRTPVGNNPGAAQTADKVAPLRWRAAK